MSGAPEAGNPGEPRVDHAAALRVGRNASLLLVAQVVYSLANVAAMILLGNALAARGYGEYAFYYALISLVASLADLGLGILVTRGIAREPASGARLLGDALLLKAALSGLILLVVAGGAWIVLPPSRAALITVVALASLIVHGQDPAIWVFRARERLHLEALMLILNQAIWLPLLIAGIRMHASLLWFLAAAVIAFGLRGAVGAGIVLARFYRPEFRPERARLRALLAEGLPYGAATFGLVLYGQIGLLALKALSTPADLACFNVSYLLSQPLSFVAYVLALAVFPIVARDFKDDERALRRDLLLHWKWQVLLAAPLSAGLVLLAGPIVSLMFHRQDFAPAATGLALAGAGLVVFFVNTSSRVVLGALDRQRDYFRAVVAGLVANLALCAALVRPFGYLGACVALLGAEATILVVCLRAQSRHAPARDLAAVSARPLLAALGMGALLFVLRGAHLFLLVPLGAVVYAALLLLLRVFSPGEMRVLRRLGASFGLPRAAWPARPVQDESGSRTGTG